MPPKKRSSKKSSDQSEDSWLSKFCHKKDIPVALMKVLVDYELQITTESVLAGITKQDLAGMHLVVGQKIILRQPIARLTKSAADATNAPVSSMASTPP